MGQTNLLKERLSIPFSVIKENSNGYSKKRITGDKTTLLKRIPLEKLMDLKIDYAFKQLFGNEKNN